MSKMIAKDKEIPTTQIDDDDSISLTDIARMKNNEGNDRAFENRASVYSRY